MEVYKYKCNDCGSTRFEKTENGYKCKYCGNIQDVIFSKEKEKKFESEEPIEDVQETEEEVEEIQVPVERKGLKKSFKRFLVVALGGWFGLHKFMDGEAFWGLVYLCTGGIFGIGWAIDGVVSLLDMLSKLGGSGE